jgi:4-amino-4-deoxy-L-arabinose transferase-like glycosyltransferase
MNSLSSSWHQIFQRTVKSAPLSNKIQYVVLAIILIGVFTVRLIGLGNPSLDWTAWKEIDYLLISQNYSQHGFNFFRPEITWLAEPPRVTEMEFPIVPFTAALFYKALGYNAFTGRAITLFASLLLVIFTNKLAKRELGPFIGLIASLAVGLIPLYHSFNRYLFTEPLMIAMSVVTLYYIAEWVDHQRKREWILAVFSLSLTFALKIETLYLLLPIAWIVYRKYNFELRLYKGIAQLVLSSLVIPVLWYIYAYYLETTGAHLFGIFTGHNKSQTITMLTDWRWYRIMAGRIINGILGGVYGSLLFAIGITSAAWLRKAGLFFSYLISVGIYFILVAEGQIDAPYRQMTLIPAAAVFVALGAKMIAVSVAAVFSNIRVSILKINGYQGLLLGSLLIILLVPLQRYNDIIGKDSPIHWDRWQIAQEINQYANQEDKLVVVGEYSKHVGGYDLSPVLYYYTGLQGWTLTPEYWTMDYIDNLREKGATLFVSLLPYGYPYDFIYLPVESPQIFIDQLKMQYLTLYEYEDQLILDLTKEKQ